MHKRWSRWSSVVRLGSALGWGGLLILLGCSSDPRGKLYPVAGKITMADGKPVPPGSVTFLPIEADPKTPTLHPSEGPIGQDGSYTLSTKGKPGAPAGKYRVALTPGADKKAWLVVPRQYTKQKMTPLEVEVVENKPEGGYDLKLQPQSGQRR